MTEEEKLATTVQKLYVGYEDRNPTNKRLFKLAKSALKKGWSSFEYTTYFDIGEEIPVNEFNWEDMDLDYADFITNHVSYLNKKFAGYFKFSYDKTVAYKVRGSMGVFDTIEATFTIYCEKIYL